MSVWLFPRFNQTTAGDHKEWCMFSVANFWLRAARDPGIWTAQIAFMIRSYCSAFPCLIVEKNFPMIIRYGGVWLAVLHMARTWHANVWPAKPGPADAKAAHSARLRGTQESGISQSQARACTRALT